VEDALPPLLEKSVDRNWRVVVQTVSPDRSAFLDGHLWTFRTDSFLPHGMEGDEFAVRFLIDGAEPSDLSGYERVVFMFDGHDEGQLTFARGQWKKLKGEGHSLSYWQQNHNGRWEKKA
jgi:DNA polymerase-3 subunit chi